MVPCINQLSIFNIIILYSFSLVIVTIVNLYDAMKYYTIMIILILEVKVENCLLSRSAVYESAVKQGSEYDSQYCMHSVTSYIL